MKLKPIHIAALLSALAWLGSTRVMADQQELWTAHCTDGQNTSYSQMRNGMGKLTLRIRNPNTGRSHAIVVGTLKQTLYNGTAICGTMEGGYTHIVGVGPAPVVHLCMNRSRNIISVTHQPQDGGEPTWGVFCAADVRVKLRNR